MMITYNPAIVSGDVDTDLLKIVTPLGTTGAFLTGTPIAARSTCDCIGVGNFGGGDGSVGDPYQICSRTHLENMHTNIVAQSGWRGIDFIQCNDINLGGSGSPFTPIGLDLATFEGNYDGNYYLIGNFYYHNNSKDYVGLFSRVGGSIIKNVILYNLDLEGNNFIGGVAGVATYSNLQNIQSGGGVVASKQSGGIVGRISNTLVQSSFSHGLISSTQANGGIVGSADSNSTIQSVFSTRSNSGATRVGGVIGELSSSTLSDSFSLGNISGTTGVGGVVGSASSSTMTRSFSTGNVSGTGSAGGFVGSLQTTSQVEQCYATGDVSATNVAGGFVGSLVDSTLDNVYATGTVLAAVDSAGGLIGLSSGGTVNTSYMANPSVSSAGNAWYISGDNPQTLSYMNLYYWNDVILVTGFGITPVCALSCLTALDTAAMQVSTNFSGFDFSSIWTMSPTGNKFPELRLK